MAKFAFTLPLVCGSVPVKSTSARSPAIRTAARIFTGLFAEPVVIERVFVVIFAVRNLRDRMTQHALGVILRRGGVAIDTLPSVLRDDLAQPQTPRLDSRQSAP